MTETKLKIDHIPAILYGASSDKLYIFVHGRYSKKEEAENFAKIATLNGYQVISFDLPEHGERKNEPLQCTVQNGMHDLEIIYSYCKDRYKSLSLYACSLGAYFSLMAYQNVGFATCLFISPILDMERLIQNMMKWVTVSEDRLKKEKIIETSFGENLSWEYYQFVKNHPIRMWNNQTFILYGENDNLTEKDILNSFSEKYKCDVTIMNNGKHYFHTPEQLAYLESWTKQIILFHNTLSNP